jgi:hypothetical protein
MRGRVEVGEVNPDICKSRCQVFFGDTSLLIRNRLVDILKNKTKSPNNEKKQKNIFYIILIISILIKYNKQG